MSLAGFCLSKKEATAENAIASVDGNICRCTGYKSIERAAAKVADVLAKKKDSDPLAFVADNNILPEYFRDIKGRLKTLALSLNGELVSSKPAAFVGGGTDLYVQKHEEMRHADIQFMYDKAELNGVRKEGNKCIVGPSATVTDLWESEVFKEYFPQFEKHVKLVSSTPIRNMATIAGNFINASPIGDFTIFFLALDATVVLAEWETYREVPLRKLYKGYKTLDKKPEEYIQQIWFELPTKKHVFSFEKVSKRTNLDIASVNTAMLLKMDGKTITEAGLAAGGVGPVPMYLEKASEFLKGKKVSDELIGELIAVVQGEISPISDARGTAEYKRLLLGQLVKGHFIVGGWKLEVGG